MKARKLIIGDIHGAYRAVKQLIERLEVTENDTLIFLGDYVDGWSESKQVIEYLIGLESLCPCIFIRGNHDTWCEAWLKDGTANETWLQHGGALTVESYADVDVETKAAHLAFFQRMQNYHIDADNNLFIHAGFSSMHGPEKEMYASNYSWDRTLWEMALTMDVRIAKDSKSYPKRLKLFREIFIGHTPTLNYDVETPMHAINVWNIDTGAAFYGRLSALDAATKEYWQSDVVRELYPGEKGRNKA
jgi:serine/threonine protein phosphatase 1